MSPLVMESILWRDEKGREYSEEGQEKKKEIVREEKGGGRRKQQPEESSYTKHFQSFSSITSYQPPSRPKRQGLSLCPFHRLVYWGTGQFTNLPKMHAEQELKHFLLPPESRLFALPNTDSQENGIWRKFPILPLFHRKMDWAADETLSPTSAHSGHWPHFAANSSLVYLPPTQFLKGRNVSSICQSGFATGNSCLHPHTCRSLNAESSGGVLGPVGLYINNTEFLGRWYVWNCLSKSSFSSCSEESPFNNATRLPCWCGLRNPTGRSQFHEADFYSIKAIC